MEKSRIMPLIFECNDFDVNPKLYWKEIIQVVFIKNDFEYIAITRLPYEDDIYIEYCEQVNFSYSYYKDVIFVVKDNSLLIETPRATRIRNLSSEIRINIWKNIENLDEILNSLRVPTIDLD